MNVLVVGAGAVGQVYAWHLQRAGARVAFFVRPHAAEACRAGMTLYPLKRGKRREPVELRASAVYTSLDEVAAQTWDQVWFCVPANALDEGWLGSIAAAVGSALCVALPPGIDSEERIRKAFPQSAVVPGMIGMISYQAPLPGESVPRPGVAYLFPPGSPSAFGGPEGRAVAALLARGGCPAVAKQSVAVSNAIGSGLLMANIAALELSGWSLAELRWGPWLRVAAHAARQSMRVASARLGARTPFSVHLISTFTLRLMWTVAPWVLPLDLETYLRYHFTKVGAQTRQLLDESVREAKARGLHHSAIDALLESLG